MAALTLAVFGLQSSAFAQSYDLSSKANSLTATNTQPVSIHVGGSSKVITPGELITPAEMVALTQVLHGGRQTLVVGAQGNATAGRFGVMTDAGQSLGALLLPKAVMGLVNFNVGALNIGGDLTNSGSIYGYATNLHVLTGVINAANIYNNGIISTVVPTSLQALTGSPRALNLSLNASGVIANGGTISSSGMLDLTAGSGVINNSTGLMAGATGLALNANNIVNAGLISAVSGNLNIAGLVSSDLVINNSGGILKAAQGDINVNDASFAGTTNFRLTGGDVLSKELNIYQGCGDASLNVRNITGIVNITAGSAHVIASTPSLKLGTIDLTGDPTFFNTAGDVVLTGSITTPGADVAIVASRNILTSTSNLNIDTSIDAAGSNGGNVLMVAGVNMTVDTVGNGNVNGTGPDSGTTVTITGPSASGGSIDLKTHPLNNFTTTATDTATNSPGNGGNVEMVAFAGANNGSGRIAWDSATPLQTGSGSSQDGLNNGSVTVIAGARSGVGIDAGAIDTSAGQNGLQGSGAVLLRTSTPHMSGSIPILDGTASGGTFQAGNTTAASVNEAGIITDQANVTILGGKDVGLKGDITTHGGNLAIFAGGNITQVGGTPVIDTQGTSPTNMVGGGNVILAAGVNSTSFNSSPVDEVDVQGASPNGGSILFTTLGSSIASNSGNGSGKAGGDVTLIANAGLNSGSGRVVLTGTSGIPVITTGGDGSGTNSGNITVIAGHATTSPVDPAVDIGDLDTTGGDVGTGRISITTANLDKTSLVPYSNGAIQSGGFTAEKTLRSGDVNLGNITGGGAKIDVSAGRNLTLSFVTDTGLGQFTTSENIITMFANGVMTLNGDISANEDSSLGSRGGKVDLTAQSFLAPSGALISADAAANGNGDMGGTVSITATGKTSSINIGPNSNQIAVSVQGDITGGSGGTAGFVFVTAGGNITVDGTAIQASAIGGSNGGGGGISITAGTGGAGTLFVTNSLNANGDGTGPGGDIEIQVNSKVAFDVGSPVTNGAVFLSAGPSADSAQAGTVNITNLGTGGINLSVPDNIVVVSTNSSEGTIGLNAPAGKITTSNVGALTVGAGGEIDLTAKSYVLGGNLLLSADGNASSSSGGTINITSTAAGAAGNITVGPATNAFTISAVDTNGIAGTLNINSGSNIKIDVGSLTLSSGAANNTQGAIITLLAAQKGPGTVFINGPLDVGSVGGTGGSIDIECKSATPFIVGPTATTNGVQGSLSADGDTPGSVAVFNFGGAVTVNSPITVVATTGDGGSIDIEANGKLIVNQALSADGGSNGSGGSIFLSSAKGLVFVNGSLSANSSNSTGSGGYVEIDEVSATPFIVGPNSPVQAAGATGTISATGFSSGGILIINNTGTGGITIGSGPAIDVTSGTSGGTISLTASAGNILVKSALSVNAGATGSAGNLTLSTQKGNVYVLGGLTANSSTSTGGSITITSNSAVPFNVTGATSAKPNGTSGSIQVNGVNAGKITITNGGTGGIIATSASTDFGFTNTNNGGNLVLNAVKGTVALGGTLDLSANGGPKGGNVTIISNSSTPFDVGGGTTNGTGNVNVTGPSAGTVTLINNGSGGLQLDDPGNIDVLGGTTKAGILKLLAPNGPVRFVATTNAATTFSASSFGIGGTITIQGKSFVMPATGSVTMTADAAGGQNAGQISLYTTGAGSNISLGNGNGSFNISAQGNGTFGAGGILNVSAGGNVTYNGTGVNLNPENSSPGTDVGNGGKLYITAGTAGAGTLNAIGGITENGNTNGGFGGIIAITVNSSKPFVIGAGGNVASLTANAGSNGGSIGVKNLGTGGITVDATQLDVRTATNQAGVIDFEAPKGTLTLNGTIDVDASIFNAGTVTLGAQLIKGTNPAISAIGAPGNNGGHISVTQTSASTPLILGGPNGIAINANGAIHGTVLITSGSNINIGGPIGTSNTDFTLTVSKAGTINSLAAGDVLTAGSLTINAGTGNIGTPTTAQFGLGATNLQTQANNLSVNTQGNAFIENAAALTLEVVTQTVKTGKTFSLENVGDINVLSAITMAGGGKVNLSNQGTAGNNISLVGNISAPVINLLANNSITSPTGTIGGANGTVNASTVGSNGIGLNTAASSININAAGGVVNLQNQGSSTVSLQGIFNTVTITNAGSITIKGILNSTATTINTTNNGSILLSGGINGGTNITLNADGAGSIVVFGSGSPTLNASGITLTSGYGNIGTATLPLNLITSSVFVSTGGAGSVNLSINQPAAAPLTIGGATSGGNMQIVNNGQINTSDNSYVAALHGSVTVRNSGTTGDIIIGQQSSTFAGAGPLNIENDNTSGLISLDTGAGLIANGKVNVSIGPIPTTGTQPLSGLVGNFFITVSGSSQAFFSTLNTVVGNAPQNDVNALGSDVVLNPSATVGSITFNGGVTVTANAAPTIITSLDLSNASVRTTLNTLATTPGSGVTGSANAGGTLKIDPTVNLANLTAFNIPKGVTVEFDGFTDNNPIGVNLSSTSTSKTASIAGKVVFNGVGSTGNETFSNGLMQFNSSNVGTVFNVAASGSTTSDTHLQVSIGGNTTLAGAINAPGDIAIITTAGNTLAPNVVPAAGAGSGLMTISGKLSAGAITEVGTLSLLSNSSIIETAGSLTGSTITLSVFGSNQIQQKSGKITADVLNINDGSLGSKLGSVAKSLSANSIVVNDANFGGVSNITDTALCSLQVTSSSDLRFNAVAGISGNHSIVAANVYITTPLLVDSNVIVAANLNTGVVNVSSTKDLSMTTGTVVGSGGITISAKGNLTQSGVLTSPSSSINVSAGKSASLAGTMNAGSAVYPGFGSTVNLFKVSAKGGINISAGTGGIITTSTTNLRSNGADISIKTTGSFAGFATKNWLAAGGNIVVGANKTVTLFSFNPTAAAVGTVATNASGGGIEISSGAQKNNIAKAFLLPPSTRPQLPLNFPDNAPSTGVILLNTTGATSTNATVFGSSFTSGGVLVFDLTGSKSSLLLFGNFNTAGFSPIGYETREHRVESNADEVIVDSNECEQDGPLVPVSMR